MRGKMLLVSIVLLLTLLFVETASAQINVTTLDELIDALKGNETEIAATQTIVIDESVEINGQGKTVQFGANAYMRFINSDGQQKNVTLKNITIDGGNLQRSTALVVVAGKGNITLTLGEGAIIQNAWTSENGGAIELSSVKLEMNGGSILNCKAQNGGGIYLGSDSTVQMNEGTISGCSAVENGGAIFSSVDSGSNEVNLAGGTIEKNSANIGGGVYIELERRVEPTPDTITQGRMVRSTVSGAAFNRTGGMLCGNTATQGGADFALINGVLVSLGDAPEAYNGYVVDGWYWDSPGNRYSAENRKAYQNETNNLYLIAAVSSEPVPTPSQEPSPTLLPTPSQEPSPTLLPTPSQTPSPTPLPDPSRLPKTGDERQPLLWLAALGGCAALAAALRRKR